MKVLLTLLPLLLCVAGASRARRVDRGSRDAGGGGGPLDEDLTDQQFLESLLAAGGGGGIGGGGGGGGGGGSSGSSGGGSSGGGSNGGSSGSSGGSNGGSNSGGSSGSSSSGGLGPKPSCGSTADATSLSDDAFLAALQGGCAPDEPPPEPGTPCERGEFQCTPYHRCAEEDIVSDGLGAFNVRIGLAQFQEEVDFITHSECPRFGDVCCQRPQSAPPTPREPAVPYEPRCGHRNVDGLGARIIGFQEHESQFGELPWVAAVVRLEDFGGEQKRLFVCAGSLVHPQLVLTAAHCIGRVAGEQLSVRLGEWDTQNESELHPHVDINVTETRVHPGFHPRLLRDDVALLVLAQPAPLQPHIGTLCLPAAGVNYDGVQCVAAGWGKDALEQGHFQTVLKHVELPHVAHGACQAALRKTKLRKYFRLDRSFTCAGGEAGVDTCTGDGGAALACRDPTQPDRWVQLGVVSWGVGCGEEGVPGVYADVRRQVDWIGGVAREVEQRGVDLSLLQRQNHAATHEP